MCLILATWQLDILHSPTPADGEYVALSYQIPHRLEKGLGFYLPLPGSCPYHYIPDFDAAGESVYDCIANLEERQDIFQQLQRAYIGTGYLFNPLY